MKKPIYVILCESEEKKGIGDEAFEDMSEAMYHSAKLSSENKDKYYYVKEITLYGQKEKVDVDERLQ